MSLSDDVKTLRNFLSRMGSTESAWKALDRLEATLPKKTIMDQFEALAVGTRFRTGKGSIFVKVGEKSVVRSYLTFGNVESEYYSDVHAIDQYAHWKNYDDEIVTISDAQEDD